MKHWMRMETSLMFRSTSIQIAFALSLWVMAAAVAASLGDPELRPHLPVLFRSAQIVMLSVLVPWAVARVTERRGSDFVLELVLTGSSGASALVSKAVATAGLVCAILILTVPVAMVVLVSTTIPLGQMVGWYAGSFVFGVSVAVMSLHLNVNWRNPLFPLVLSWGGAGGGAGLYFLTFDPLAGGVGVLGWGLAALVLTLGLIPRGNREFGCID